METEGKGDKTLTRRKSLKLKNKTTDRQGQAAAKKRSNDSAQVRKSVKDRLGSAPVQQQNVVSSSESSQSDSDSDSDDSIENIKVMTMEEIFRQKALDSMMKKRAAEGTPPVPSLKPAKSSPPPLEKKQIEESSSSPSEEESEEESSSTSSESSSSESDEESSDEGPQFEEPDVRRVVVDVESENAARVKAKASLLRKQKKESLSISDARIKTGRVTKATTRKSDGAHLSLEKKGKNLNRRMVNVDYDSDDLVSCRVREPLVLNVRDRLGKPPTKPGTGPLSRLDKKEVTNPSKSAVSTSLLQKPKVYKTRKISKSSSGDEPDPLAQVKIKSLEEIRQEKMKALASQQTALPKSSPVKERLGIMPHTQKEEKSEKQQGRQVLLMNDSGSKSDDASSSRITEEQRKSKRRPWRSLKRNLELTGSEEAGNDERTTVLSSELGLGPKEKENNADASIGKERTIVESPFESLRRRALMKKIQKGALKQKATGSVNRIEITVPDAGSPPRRSIVHDFEDVVKQDVDNHKGEESRKTHKHKHKHKHEKKSKTERQIYLPPAMKSTSFSKSDEQTSKVEPLAPTAKVAPQKREPHPMAAIWADGLTLPAKGSLGRRPEMSNAGTLLERFAVTERVGISSRLGNKDESQSAKARVTTSEPSEQTPELQSGVVIKSFSEIMAEKRRRRLELQAQKSGTALSSAPSLPSNPAANSPTRASEAKPKAPITPIIFNLDSTTAERQKPCKDSTLAVCPVPRTSNQPMTVSTFSSTTVSATLHSEHSNGASQERQKFKPAGTPMARNKTNQGKLFKRKKSLDQSNESGHSGDVGRSQVQGQTSQPAPAGTEASQGYTPSTSQKPNLSAKAPTHPNTKHKSFEGEDLTDSSYCKPSTEHVSPAAMSIFSQVPTTSAVSPISTTPVGNKHKTQEVLKTETEPLKKKNRLSIEDEFSFFDDEELEDDNFITGDVEPIDDLLQDIDDLLS